MMGKLRGGVAAGLMLAAVAVGMSIGTASAEDLLIGFLAAETGPFVSLSKTNEIAARMALEEINKAGGIDGRMLKLLTFDTAGKPDQSVVGLRKLAEDDQVLAIIGPFSSAQVRVVFPAAERIGVATMSMASSAPKLAEPFTYAFRNTSDEGYMFERLMRSLAAAKYPMATAAVAFATDDVISQTMGEKVLPAILKQHGVDLKLSVDFRLQAFDFSPQVSQLKSQPTDLVAVGSPPEAAIKLVQELRRQGDPSRLVAGSTIADPDLPTRMGKDGDGTIIPTTFFEPLNERTRQFGAEFTRRAKAAGSERTLASQFDAATFDIVQFYAEAMRQTKATGAPAKVAAERTAIRDALRRLKDFPSIEGPISIGPDGDALKPVYIIELKDATWRLLGTHPAG
jgi:branched-chain amino acid transport system substrate-binding protein